MYRNVNKTEMYRRREAMYLCAYVFGLTAPCRIPTQVAFYNVSPCLNKATTPSPDG